MTSTVEPHGVPVIDVDDRVRYQQFTGLGAAMTDSSAWLINQLSPSARLALTQALFGKPGRPDYARRARHPSELPPRRDRRIGSHDRRRAVQLRRLVAGKDGPDARRNSRSPTTRPTHPGAPAGAGGRSGTRDPRNPWSPPAWMKSNDSLDNPNAQGTLLSSDYGPLAQYFVKFIQAYESYGVPVDALTPQNEPSSGTVPTNYPGLTLPEPAEAQFIDRYLTPALRSAGLDTRIYGNDLSWDSSDYAGSLASGPAAPDLSGIAWHCYFGSPNVMSDLHQTAPGLDQIVTECSPRSDRSERPSS